MRIIKAYQQFFKSIKDLSKILSEYGSIVYILSSTAKSDPFDLDVELEGILAKKFKDLSDSTHLSYVVIRQRLSDILSATPLSESLRKKILQFLSPSHDGFFVGCASDGFLKSFFKIVFPKAYARIFGMNALHSAYAKSQVYRGAMLASGRADMTYLVDKYLHAFVQASTVSR